MSWPWYILCCCPAEIETASDVFQDPVAFNLFLLALDSLYAEVANDDNHLLRKRKLEEDYLSFFHIAGKVLKSLLETWS